mmetsp:Transcript_42911/g.135422  ORF Transcript_42911/g.135422 Transcript_42911/m.135422 type:complete len:108 (+) Transcript_42911:1510-1833(+)
MHRGLSFGKGKLRLRASTDMEQMISSMRSSIPRFKVEKKIVISDDYEKLLRSPALPCTSCPLSSCAACRNPDQIDLKFQIQGNLVIKKLSDTQQMIVGRQAPASLPS